MSFDRKSSGSKRNARDERGEKLSQVTPVRLSLVVDGFQEPSAGNRSAGRFTLALAPEDAVLYGVAA